jgi:site-specific recombinase XerC
VGSPRGRKDARADDGQEYLTALQGLRPDDRLPRAKPHDLRHGVAMEVLEQHHDLEQVRALLGHSRIDTTQIYTSIRLAQLKRAVSFYEEKASKILTE